MGEDFVGPMPQDVSAAGLLSQIGSSIGAVADFGFNLQNQQLAVQSKSQDIQLKSLLGTLGFQTASIQAQSAADIARINAQRDVARATSGGGSMSPTVLLLGAGLIYLLAKKG